MSNSIVLTSKTITTITERIKSDSSKIEYSISIPADVDMSQGVILAWKETVENEEQYVDVIQDNENVDDILTRMGVDFDSLFEENEDTEIEAFHFGEGIPVSLCDFKAGLRRAILSDLGSAWASCIREAIEDICGEDPLGGNEGLEFV